MNPGASRIVLAALLVLALAAPAGALAPWQGPQSARGSACSVPCGYIYPLILIGVEGKNEPRPLAAGETLTIPAKLTFRFDVVNEGFTLPDPQQPIVVTFEYPKKPDWARVEVEPAQIEIPIQPQYIQPDASDPQNLQGYYVYEADLSISIAAPGQAVLPDGLDYAKLLVFAKSTESGLYKAGYGIKELRVAPEGAIHASDLEAGAERVVADVPAALVAPLTRTAPGMAVTVTPPAGGVKPWEPAVFEIAADVPLDDPTPLGLVATLVDEAGVAWYSTGLRTSEDGKLAVRLTLPGAGLHTLAVLVAPPPGSVTPVPPTSFAFPILVETPEGADALRYPREYLAEHAEIVTGASGNVDEPLAQFTKDVAIPVLPGSSGAAVALTLRAEGAPLPTGPGSVSFQLLDPEGAVVLQGGVDAANAARRYDAGALPGQGVYRLRISGVGVPFVTAYDVQVAVAYDDAPVADATTDGALDAVTAPVAVGVAGVTLAAPDAMEPWVAAPLAASVEGYGGGAVSYAATIMDSSGNLVYNGHFRVADASGFVVPFLAPESGDFTLLLFAQPAGNGVRGFEPTVLAFPLRAGSPDAERTALPQAIELADAGTLAAHSLATVALEQRVRVLDGASPLAVHVAAMTRPGGAIVVRALDADGAVAAQAAGPEAALDLAPGVYVVQVVLDTAGETAIEATLAASYDAPPVLENPLWAAGGNAPGKSFLPAPGALAALALGLLAAALRRRS